MTLTPIEYFASLVQQDDSIPLFEAALSIAQDADPELDMTALQMEIDLMAQRLQRRFPADASPIQKLRLLNHFFYRELGFAGNVNDYYAPDNSYLHRVLTTRRGIPISLAVVYMELAQQIGLDVRGISFPGHFLMKLSVSSGEVILDPFNGASLSREDLEERLEPYVEQGAQPAHLPLALYLREAQPRQILVRMLRNLKSLHASTQDWRKLLKIQERLVVLLPDEVEELRDRGLAYAELECPQAALRDLQAYLQSRPDAPDNQALRQRMPELERAAKRMN
jgi:regulator of sirC expression with transglutaminase-like and TPR domain